MSCILVSHFRCTILMISISNIPNVCFIICLECIMLNVLYNGNDTFNSIDLRREMNEIIRECSALQENQMEVMEIVLFLII